MIHTTTSRSADLRHVRRGVLAVAAAATLLLAVGATPATAAPRMLPDVGAGIAVAPAPSTLDALRSALEALPNSAEVHISQIDKNFEEGVLG
ncbi:MAG TPA: hypothetical protein VIG76_14275 [Amnibacterium sp.]|jgi:hypothetical protein|uniref:hypothetical protein n=1 Tax=Amnibacterium sp. TaxID=1872496 RepID=UPI002F92169E